MIRTTTDRHGFTFAELLIVIAVIGILVSLLLPAVQACREAAHRNQCANNLQQLMVAIQNYENMHSVYPIGTTDSKRPILSQPVGHHHNWISRILPFLDRRAAFDAIDWRSGVYDPRNLPVRRLHLNVLNCPSSPNRARGYSSYAGVHHDIEAPIDITNNGVFFLNSRIRNEDLLDGSSQTIFIGE